MHLLRLLPLAFAMLTAARHNDDETTTTVRDLAAVSTAGPIAPPVKQAKTFVKARQAEQKQAKKEAKAEEKEEKLRQRAERETVRKDHQLSRKEQYKKLRGLDGSSDAAPPSSGTTADTRERAQPIFFLGAHKVRDTSEPRRATPQNVVVSERASGTPRVPVSRARGVSSAHPPLPLEACHSPPTRVVAASLFLNNFLPPPQAGSTDLAATVSRHPDLCLSSRRGGGGSSPATLQRVRAAVRRLLPSR